MQVICGKPRNQERINLAKVVSDVLVHLADIAREQQQGTVLVSVLFVGWVVARQHEVIGEDFLDTSPTLRAIRCSFSRPETASALPDTRLEEKPTLGLLGWIFLQTSSLQRKVIRDKDQSEESYVTLGWQDLQGGRVTSRMHVGNSKRTFQRP